MAILKKELHNNLSGRIGDLIYYQLGDKTCIRSRSSSYRDKKSAKQILHRTKIKTLGKLFLGLRPAMRFEIRDKYGNQSNYFYKLNWDNVLVDSNSVSINYPGLVLSNQINIKLLDLEIVHLDNKVSFNWRDDNMLDDSFRVLCAVYCKSKNRVYVTEAKRNSMSAMVTLPIDSREIVTYAYTFRRLLD